MSSNIKEIFAKSCGITASEAVSRLRQFDFANLNHPTESTRKVSLISLFAILSSVDLNQGIAGDAQERVVEEFDAPLIIKDDIIYLAINSGDSGLSKCHAAIASAIKRKTGLLADHVLAFQPVDLENGSSSVFSITKQKITDIKNLEDKLKEIGRAHV